MKTCRHYSKKKTLIHPKADKQQRLLFLKQLAAFEAEGRTLIYLDESGFKSHDNRAYGYSHKGCPCLGKYNWQLKNQSNAIGAIHKNKLFAVGLYDCSINSDVFHCWVEELLLTQLPENSVIIMDNASFHKRQDTQELIADAGHHILWLPPYSPDLNPIEKMWAWLKRKRKDWRLNCIDKLFFYFLWICNSF
ncbi:IS630 family transposase [Suttonella indologenes]|uniref:IS630 family transposase n=1 Tax=Suttonella indologenes TaxID=13276 RepID=UPI000E1C0D1D